MSTGIRRAVPQDAAAMVRLRAAMFEAMGRDPGPEDAPWREAASAWFVQHLAVGGTAIAVVSDVPGTGPVASALAVLLPRAPGPGDADTVAAHVSQVSTLPEHRRRGHARACLTALLVLLDEAGAHRADLHATRDGEALYRALGFEPAPWPALRRRSTAG